MKSSNTGSTANQIPLQPENDERLRDLHKPGPEHLLKKKTDQTVPYSDSFLYPTTDDQTRPYDQDFFANKQRPVDPNNLPYLNPFAAKERDKQSAEANEVPAKISRSTKFKVDQASRQASSADYQYIIPNRIEPGSHLGAGIANGKPLAVGLFSNTNDLDIAEDQTARIGVAAIKYHKNHLDVNMMDFQIVNQEQKRRLPQLLALARKSGGLAKMNLPDREAGQLNLGINLDAYVLSLKQTPGSRSICFIIRGRDINKISGTSSESGSQPEYFSLEHGDIVLAISDDLMRSLVQKMTKSSVANLPDRFVEGEGALQLYELIRKSMKTSRSTGANKNSNTVESKHFSPQTFFDGINEKIREDFKSSTDDNISVESFFAYQVP